MKEAIKDYPEDVQEEILAEISSGMLGESPHEELIRFYEPKDETINKANEIIEEYYDFIEFGLPEPGGSLDQPYEWLMAMRYAIAAKKNVETINQLQNQYNQAADSEDADWKDQAWEAFKGVKEEHQQRIEDRRREWAFLRGDFLEEDEEYELFS